MADQLEKIRGYVEDLKQTWDEKTHELGDAVDDQAEEIRKFGGTLSDTSKAIEQIEEKLRGLEEQRKELDELATKFDLVDKWISRGHVRGGDMPADEMRSVGRKFAESDQLKSFIEDGGEKSGTVKVDRFIERKAGTLSNAETGWGGMGPLIQPYELGEIIEDPRRQFFVRDLLRIIPVTSESVHFIEEIGFAPLYTVTTAAITGATTPTSVVPVEGTAGMFEGQTIRIGDGPQRIDRIIATGGINAQTNQVTVTVPIAVNFAAGSPVTSEQLAMIPHGGRKPQASLRFADQTVNIGTIADWIAVHKQTLSDAGVVASMIDNRLRYGVALAEEYQLLWGNGVNPNLTGMMVNANVQNHGNMVGLPAGDTPIDHIRRALTKAEIAQFPPNGIIMNPISWEVIELQKDSTGQYIYLNIGQGNQRRLFALPVVTTTGMPAPNFLVGAFGLAAYLFDREQTNLAASESHGTFFTENTVAIRAESRVGLGVVRPEALTKGSFARS